MAVYHNGWLAADRRAHIECGHYTLYTYKHSTHTLYTYTRTLYTYKHTIHTHTLYTYTLYTHTHSIHIHTIHIHTHTLHTIVHVC